MLASFLSLFGLLSTYTTLYPPFEQDDWRAVNDQLRGGSSTSHFDVVDDGQSGLFYGILDTQTLGGAGFASQNTVFDSPVNLSNDDGLVLDIIDVDTTGPHTFTLNLKNTQAGYRNDGRRQSSLVYESDFTAEKAGRVKMPWDSFKATYRGKRVHDAAPLDTAHITELSFMCRSMFQQVPDGPFHIKVGALQAYRGWHYSFQVADSIREILPDTDELVVEYLAGYLTDEDVEESDILHSLALPMLASASVKATHDRSLLEQLEKMLQPLLPHRESLQPSEPAKLENAFSMRAADSMSKTVALEGSVDLESATKGHVSRVDLKKLEKAEAKIKAKMEKRSKRDLYQGSKLLDAQKTQQSYEELFMQVNPLNFDKGKSKDVLLHNVDVSMGSNKILTSATLQVAQGKRYGWIGRNGAGKSTVLRAMALREVPVPNHISILYVEQEIIGDDTTAIESVLAADIWRTHYINQELELNGNLQSIEDKITAGEDAASLGSERDELATQLGECQEKLVEMEAHMGPIKAAFLLAGLGFSESDQQKPTSSFSGGWRMRLALARALFVQPDLLLLDEPSNMLDLNALAWLEDYLQTWPSTILVVSHDRAFLDHVATDIIHQHSERLDYYKGNFSQFYETKTERGKNELREYESQLQYRQHLQAFVDRWRYNAARASQAQSKIKILEKLPELHPPETEDSESFKFPDAEKISPPLLQLDNITFGYSPEKTILKDVDLDVSYDSRIAIVGPNGAGKSTLLKLLIGELSPSKGQLNRNGRLRVAYFTQHHMDQLDLNMSPLQFTQARFPGRTAEQYRSFLGTFGIRGSTSLRLIGTLSGGQKSRLAFAMLALQNPHILLLDEPTNHLDMEGLDALMDALKVWNGGSIVISHDERFITTVARELWVCANGTVTKFKGDVQAYKSLIVQNIKDKPT
ncbi:hypothetical protein J056_002224 [Wallemia ichthyophaga EXF-994]|uniref:ABC transporter domain-containing protein n=1 Tax=Wallemia ichthyophaga (strain EXF-994 / CBS 113033) TaxID=1299270 RepID=R9AVK8_WALI9|nr:uncharacterized protein J056_002224 [Wallemia ichthyophaga EXF-994]EOR04146.1 hypothetical protein J056_002224 [Wallemia ichthyophaga EXF-994]